MADYDEESQWWREDAARLDELHGVAERLGAGLDVSSGRPPRLNPDGSLADDVLDESVSINANPKGYNQYKDGPGKKGKGDLGKKGKGDKEDPAEAERARQFKEISSKGWTPQDRGHTPKESLGGQETVQTPTTVRGLTPNRRGGYDLPSPQEASRVTPKADVDDYVKAVRLVSDRGSAHLHQVAKALGWDESRIAHAASAAYATGRAPLRAYEGGHGGLSPDEMRWSFHHEGDRMGRVQLPSGG